MTTIHCNDQITHFNPQQRVKIKSGTNYHWIDDNAMYGKQTTSWGILIDTSGTNKKLITI